MSSVYRRRSDQAANRLMKSALYLSIALGFLAAYLGYRAIKAMDHADETQAEIFRLGKIIGDHTGRPLPNGMEKQ